MKYYVNSEEEGEVIARLAADWADKRKCRLESNLHEDNDGMTATYKIVSREKWNAFWDKWQADFEEALPMWLYGQFEIIWTDSDDYDPDEEDDDDDVEIGDANDLYDDAYDALVADPDEGDDRGIIDALVKCGAIKLVKPRKYKMVNGGKIVPANYIYKSEMRQTPDGLWYCHEEWVAPETKINTVGAVETPISEYKPETYKGVITSE